MTKERMRFELDEIVMAMVDKYPTKRKSIYSAVCSALDMLSGEIMEVSSNYLDMEDEE